MQKHGTAYHQGTDQSDSKALELRYVTTPQGFALNNSQGVWNQQHPASLECKHLQNRSTAAEDPAISHYSPPSHEPIQSGGYVTLGELPDNKSDAPSRLAAQQNEVDYLTLI
jgi:hypothetical protein